MSSQTALNGRSVFLIGLLSCPFLSKFILTEKQVADILLRKALTGRVPVSFRSQRVHPRLKDVHRTNGERHPQAACAKGMPRFLRYRKKVRDFSSRSRVAPRAFRPLLMEGPRFIFPWSATQYSNRYMIGVNMAYKAPKGTKDVLPEESYRWQYLEQTMRSVVRKYGLLEARTPCIEHTELFLRGVGNTTDIVQKEMYTFTDKGDRSITLKPEGTAGAVRMFVENGLFSEAQPTKMFYLYCPVFRYERPQAGRLREHHQFGVEVFGAPDASADAEVIAIASELFETIGVHDLTIKLNSIGCPKCRGNYQNALREYLKGRYDELCPDCKSRFETNPLRILDCKVDHCKEIVKEAPHTMDYVCDDCRNHMDQLTSLLDAIGIRYELDSMLVRGLDYYTKTVFEIVSGMPGAQGTLCGGGRYDGLIKELGGPDMPAVGFGLGMERLLLIMDQLGVTVEKPLRYELMLLGMGDEGKKLAFVLCQKLRALGICADTDHVGRSVKAQMKYADKVGAANVLVLGDNEISENKALIKNMKTGAQIETSLLPEEIVQKLRG